MKKKLTSKIMAIVIAVTAILGVWVPGETVYAKAWDPSIPVKNLNVRFWDGEDPVDSRIRFYINAGERYILETVKNPSYGTNSGEWSILCLLRGMYTGLDYMNKIPQDYFNGYIGRLEDEVTKIIEDKGTLHKSKSTEYSRIMLALSALGYDVTNVAGRYDFIEKLSESFSYSYRQGINGPVWQIIALNTGGYELDENPSGAEEGEENTVGKMLTYILDNEITQSDGTVGGWDLKNEVPDPDMTAMALQALAPYYLDPELYKAAGTNTSYEELAKAVERGLLTLESLQNENGGYESWGSVNAESVAQVIVALTSLQIDPKSEHVELPYLGTSCSFVRKGAIRDGVKTDNMIDALLTFWERDSGSSHAVGGFKHVTAGNDGGGGAGTSVNGMATDQAVYALIAYDRFLNQENSLYDMRDMTDGSYTDMYASSYTISYEGNGAGTTWQENCSPFGEVLLPSMEGEPGLISWNTKADGTGTSYLPGETLIMPEQDITLYARYGKAEYFIEVELNGGVLSEEASIPQNYTPASDEILLPDAGSIQKEGCLFLGWYKEQDLSGTPITKIAKGSYGDLRLYAGWRVDYTALNEFYALVNKLNIGGITISDRTDIKRARELYDGMSPAERGEIHAYSYTRFVTAEKELEMIEASLDAVSKVVSMIQNLKEPLSLQDQRTVEEAEEAYQALGEEERSQVENYQKLLQARETMNILLENQKAAKEVTDQIKQLGTITLASKEAVQKAREAVNHLTSEQRELVGQQTLKILTEAEQALSRLEESAMRVRTMKDMMEEALRTDLSLENNCLSLLTEAHAAYLALADEEKKQIPEDDWNQVQKREQELYRMADDGDEDDWREKTEVESLISALGGIIMLDDEAAILQALDAYGNLTEKQKALVENYYSLIMRHNELIQLKEDYFAADKMIRMIDGIGEVSLEKETMIHEVRTAYAALSTNQKLLVTNYSDMVKAENELADIKYDYKRASQAAEKIYAIDQVITMESKEGIDRAQAAYDGLSEKQKAYITEEQKKILENAGNEYKRIEGLQLKKIALNENQLMLQPGETKVLNHSYDPEDTISDKTAVWSSSNEKVVSVDDGKVTGKENGDAVITVRVGKLSVACSVQVRTVMKGITISSQTVSMTKGDTGLLSVGFLPSSTTDDRTLIWKTSNPKAAVVNAGKITAVGAGTAMITVTCGKLEARCQVTVQNYRLVYVLNGGRNSTGNPSDFDGGSAVRLKEPVRPGYIFLGWYLDGRYQNSVTAIPAGKGQNYTLFARWKKVKKPSKPVLRQVQSKTKGKLTLQLKKKAADAKGYEVQISVNKKFKKNVKSLRMTGLKKTVKNLKNGKLYYVRVRAYCLDSAGKKIAGSYSKTGKAKISK